MKAVRHLGNGQYEVADVAEPTSVQPYEAIVDVRRSGICGTDLKILSTPPGHTALPGVILGHEFVGTVAAVGEKVVHVTIGDRVAIAPDQGCGVCSGCRRGHPMSCVDPLSLGMRQDGGMAAKAAVPSAALYRLPDSIGWREAVLIEPLSCVLESMKQVDLERTGPAAVVGAGPMGLLAIALLAARATKPLLAFEPSPHRARIALSCGATEVRDGSEISMKAWETATGGYEAPSLVIDAVGHLLPACLELVADRGTVIQLGYNASTEVSFEPGVLNRKALRILSSDGSEFTFSAAIDLVASGRLRLDQIVTAEMEIDQFDAALQSLRDGTEAKVSIAFG